MLKLIFYIYPEGIITTFYYYVRKYHHEQQVIWKVHNICHIRESMEFLYNHYVIDTSKHKSKYHWKYHSCSIKTSINGENIAIVYSMLSYKLKVNNFEYDTLNFHPIIQNNNGYPRVDNNYVDDTCNVVKYYG